MQPDTILTLNGIKPQLTMHAILLNALLVELCHLAATSSSSLQPYDDLCSAVLACYRHIYRPPPGTHDFHVSPASQHALPTGPQPFIDHD